MPTLITLTEAATFLGVSKATLRNWDNDGKLVAVRNPINGYRQYDMESLIKLKNEMTGQENSLKKQNDELKSEEAKAIKRAVNKLHSIIRDSDAKKWSGQYPSAMNRWHDNWDAISPIFKFSKDVRTAFYTANAIESLNE